MPKKGEKKQTKTAASKTVVEQKPGARIRQATRKQARLRAKKEAQKRERLPSSFKLVGRSFVIIKRFWRPLLGIVAIYTVLNLVFASGLFGAASSTISGISDKQSLSQAASGFSNLLASPSSSNSSSAQTILLILESLVIIWTLRHLFASERVRIKQAYYHATAPLVQFLLVVLVLIIQLLPFTLGAAGLSLIFSTVTINSTIVGLLFVLGFLMLASWSIYMTSGSIFALYIVTLPDMEPLRALRSAKTLVKFRRWSVIRKLLLLPIFVTIFMGIFIIPLIMFASSLVTSVYFVLCMFMILFAHTYLYNLYKGLLA